MKYKKILSKYLITEEKWKFILKMKISYGFYERGGLSLSLYAIKRVTEWRAKGFCEKHMEMETYFVRKNFTELKLEYFKATNPCKKRYSNVMKPKQTYMGRTFCAWEYFDDSVCFCWLRIKSNKLRTTN